MAKKSLVDALKGALGVPKGVEFSQTLPASPAIYAGPLEWYPGTAPEPILSLPEYPEGVAKLKLSPEVAERLVRSARAGNNPMVSCAIAGVSPASLHSWKAMADSDEGLSGPEADRREYVRAFFKAFELAYGLYEASLLGALNEAATVGNVVKKKTREVLEYNTKAGPQKQVRTIDEEVINPPDPRVAQWLMEARGYRPNTGRLEIVDGSQGALSPGSPAEDVLKAIQDGIKAIAATATPESVPADPIVEADFVEVAQ